MKNALIHLVRYALILSIIFTIASCQRKYDSVTISDDDITELLNQLKSPTQKFSVLAGQSSTIVGLQGTRIHFNPNTFRDKNGITITNGTVDVELLEMPKAKDMILNRVTTISGFSTLLHSGGSINIEVTQNGEPVIIGARYGIYFKQFNASTDTMSIFVGSGSQSSIGDGFLFWSEIGTNSQNGTIIDTASAINYYAFDTVLSFNWINCDKFYNDPRPKTNVQVNLAGQDLKIYGAIVYVILPEINAAIALYQNDTNNLNLLGLDHNLKIPIGMKATFIALAKVNSEYYFAKKVNGTIATNHTDNMTLQKKSMAEIKAEINAL